VLAAVAAAMLAAGCGSGSPAMMNGSAGSRAMTTPGFGPRMGQVGGGYHLARLTCSAPSSLPGTPAYVMFADRGMTRMMTGPAPAGSQMILRAVPARVPAGQVSFVAGNMGWRAHELVVLPLAPHQPAGARATGPDGRVNETGSLGEASASCAAGSGDGISPGTVGWVTLTLPAGRYELVCNRRNHYRDGMHQAFVVTS
jgi:uncharacterized cupredoxin-like copper-binding protein